jgi:hypothetical protein
VSRAVRHVALAAALAAAQILSACGRTGGTSAPGSAEASVVLDTFRPSPSAEAAIAEERASAVPSDAPPRADSIESLRDELAQCRESAEAARASDAQRIRELEAELESATTDRVRREKQWLAYTQTVSKLGSIASAPPPFSTGDPALERAAQSSAAAAESMEGALGEGFDRAADPAPRAAATDPASSLAALAAASAAASTRSSLAASTAHRPEAAARAAKDAPPPTEAEKRDHEIFISLRSLFMVEQVGGFDLLESGALRSGSTGPAVMRVLDERGHPLGTLYAERMRLQGSRAARTVTIVLEDGYERREREKTEFSAVPSASSVTSVPDAGASTPPRAPRNVRRIVLPDVDPQAWIDALPELFSAEEREPPPDDGRWDLGALRAALNDLLHLDAAAGLYRLKGVAGVVGDTLRDVQIDALDSGGRLERKLFADRMRIAPADHGIVIQLEGGAQLRGDEKTPFLDNRYRIFLPSANLDEWRKAGIPGLSPAPSAKKP